MPTVQSGSSSKETVWTRPRYETGGILLHRCGNHHGDLNNYITGQGFQVNADTQTMIDDVVNKNMMIVAARVDVGALGVARLTRFSAFLSRRPRQSTGSRASNAHS